MVRLPGIAQVITDDQFTEEALERPSTFRKSFGASAADSLLQSPGLGTVIREGQTPPLAKTPDIRRSGLSSGRGGVRWKYETPQEVEAKGDTLYESDTDFKKSPSYRPDIPFEKGMTESRAKAMAEMNDLSKVRQYWAAKRPVAAFLGGVAGSALDPVNYIPLVGPAARAASVARVGRVAGRVLTTSSDAALNSAIFQTALSDLKAKYGDDVSWAAIATNAAFSALGGAVIGGAAAGLAKFRGWDIPDVEIPRAADEVRAAPNVTETPIPVEKTGVRADDLSTAGEATGKLIPDRAVSVGENIGDRNTPVYRTLSRLETAANRTKAAEVMNEALFGLIHDGEVRLGQGSQDVIAGLKARVDGLDEERFFELGEEHRLALEELEDALGGPSSGRMDDVTDLINLSRGVVEKQNGNLDAYPKGLTVDETIARASETADKLNSTMTADDRALLARYIDADKKLTAASPRQRNITPDQKPFVSKHVFEQPDDWVEPAPRAIAGDADYVDLTPSGTSRSITIGDTSITFGVKEGEVEILRVQTPIALRRQGNARAAMVAFLEKVDDQGLAVRTYAAPLDRMTHAEGVIRFYESLGFTATGKKSNRAGDIEMLRAGPPPEVAELRNLVGSGQLVPLQDYRDAGMAKTVATAWYGTQPLRSLDDIYGGRAQKWQGELDRVGREIEEAIGIGFGNPGVKDRAKTEAKITRKGYKSARQLTDIVRAGFFAETPDQVQRAINMLAQKFQIIDEGWNLSDVSYFDRKVGVRFKDGTIGEIQFWNPALLNAKKAKGHKLYEEARALPQGDPKRTELEMQQRELYEEVISSLSPDWLSAIGRSGSSGNVLENAALMASSPSTTRPESMTSAESTGVQSSPGAKTAQAEPPSTTAGRSSQSKNLMDPLLTEGGGWRNEDVTVTLDDGKTGTVKAGAAVDFVNGRIKAARELMECLNAA